MATSAKKGAAPKAGLVAGGVLVVAAAGLAGWWFFGAEPDHPKAAVGGSVGGSVAPRLFDPPLDASPAPVVAAPAVVPPSIVAPPTFDLVRIESDGAAQIAGRGAAQAVIVLMVDATAVAQAPVGSDGSFVALFTLAPNPAPSLLSMLMRMPDGDEILGTETVALAPIAGPAPVVVTEVKPEVAPEVTAGAAPEVTAAAAPEVTAATPEVTAAPTPEVTAAAPAEVTAAPTPEVTAAAPPEVTAAPTSDVTAAAPAVVPADSADEVTAPVAAEPPAALLITPDSVVVLQDPAPRPAAVLANVTIDIIDYRPDGVVQFGGSGQAAQVVRLYLDNAALTETAVGSGGQWAVAAAEIAPGLYTLRADQLDKAGMVTSRFEIPFQRETLESLASAADPAPAVPGAAVPSPLSPALPTPETVAAAQPAGADAPVPQAEAPSDLPAAPEIVAAADGPAAPAVVSAANPAVVPDPALFPDPAAKPEPATSPDPAKVIVPAPVVAAAPGSEAAPAAATPPGPAPTADLLPDPAQPAAPEAVATPVPAAAVEPAPAVVQGTAPAVAPSPDPAPAPAPPAVTVTVQPGLTLWAIAAASLGGGVRYVQVYEANKDKIRDPDLIYPGQIFTVPAEQ